MQETDPESRQCALCLRPLPVGSSPRRRYCISGCRQRRWERDNTEKCRAAIWSWNVRNAARMADWHREWYRRNREHALANAREWAQANPERKRAYQRARQRRMHFRGWTAEDFRAAKQLIESVCSYCGAAGPLDPRPRCPARQGRSAPDREPCGGLQALQLPKGGAQRARVPGAPCARGLHRQAPRRRGGGRGAVQSRPAVSQTATSPCPHPRQSRRAARRAEMGASRRLA